MSFLFIWSKPVVSHSLLGTSLLPLGVPARLFLAGHCYFLSFFSLGL